MDNVLHVRSFYYLVIYYYPQILLLSLDILCVSYMFAYKVNPLPIHTYYIQIILDIVIQHTTKHGTN